MKNSITLSLLSSVMLLSGCATMFTGNRQDIEVRTYNEEVGTKLDNVVKFDVLADAYRVSYGDVVPGENISVHRTSQPIVVKVQESECILPTEEHFGASVHPAVFLDVLMTSLLSTSIDSSTGAAWRYDKTLQVTPKVKDTPECQAWLKEEVAKMDGSTKRTKRVGQSKFSYDKNTVVHPTGYEPGSQPEKEHDELIDHQPGNQR